jgi:hypothetical protein
VPADEEVYNIMENTEEESMDGSSIVGGGVERAQSYMLMLPVEASV